jgi:hypothetical protein
MLLRDKYVKKEIHGSVACSTSGMGSDPAPGKGKQCFFEAKAPAPTVKKCADEGSDCTCNGNIFYGSAIDDEKKPITKFMDIFDMPFKVVASNGSQPITCNNKKMAEDEDFLPGTMKQCFCDDIGKLS